MAKKLPNKVGVWLTDAMLEHIDSKSDYRTRSEYIRLLVEADMRPTVPAAAVEPKAEPSPKPRRSGPSLDYIEEVIRWKKGDEAQAMIDECAGVYAEPSVWFYAFAKDATFLEWDAEMRAQKTPR